MSEQAKPAGPDDLFQRVDAALERIRPFVQQDGGHVELVEVNAAEKTAYIRFQGACSG